MIVLTISSDMIKNVIGPGGKTIADTGVKIDISELAADRVEKLEDVVKISDQIMVKVMEVDSQGRINLSRKALLAPSENGAQEDYVPRGSRPGGDGGVNGRGASPLFGSSFL